MPSALETAVRAALDAVTDPVSGKGLSASGRVTGLVTRPDGKIGFVLETGVGAADEPLRKAAEDAVAHVKGVTAVTAVLTAEATTGARTVAPPRPAPHTHASPPASVARTEVTRPARGIVAIASAKGGVGKSTVAVNLAVAAAKSGLRVGLLDADVFGPSLPTMLGTVGIKPELTAAKKMKPVMAHGLATMSIGYLVDPDQAVVWRGPMVMSAVTQLINDTDWGDLDLLFIDTPPGTGEVQLTLVQKLPLDGAVIVSTPQEVALADVRRRHVPQDGGAGAGRDREHGLVRTAGWLARLHLRQGRRPAHGGRNGRAFPRRPADPAGPARRRRRGRTGGDRRQQRGGGFPPAGRGRE
jgi:ATP-binding protein involved in chromosome partitioning